jgi:hypothetical protein
LERQVQQLGQQLGSATREAAEQCASSAAAQQGLREDLSRAQAEAEERLAAAQGAAAEQQRLLQAQAELLGQELRACRGQLQQQGEQAQQAQQQWRRDREGLALAAQVGARAGRPAWLMLGRAANTAAAWQRQLSRPRLPMGRACPGSGPSCPRLLPLPTRLAAGCRMLKPPWSRK